jgi:hypothetical protein
MKNKVLFVIPLKAKEVSKDWDCTVALTLRCLMSLRNQVDQEFQTVLVCNSFPYTSESDDLTIIEENFTVPTSWEEGHSDKYRKIHRGLIEARKHAPAYIMKLDSDDMVHRDLVGYICKQNSELFIIEKGYVYCEGGRKVHATNGFHHICGSSNVVLCAPEELPSSMEEDSKAFDILRCGHTIVESFYSERGKTAHRIPFRAAVYSSRNGENHSGHNIGAFAGISNLVRQFFRIRMLTSSVRRSFALENLKQIQEMVEIGTCPPELRLKFKGA